MGVTPREPVLCALCGSPGAARACARCGTPHHQDCWDYGGGCTIYGCAGRESEVARRVPSALVEIDETTRLPAPRPAPLAALTRWLARDARALPRTLGTSLTTSLLASAALIEVSGLWAGLVVVPALTLGLGFGVLAAYGGRTLHRHPVRVGAAGAALATASAAALGLEVPGILDSLLVGLVGDVSLPFTSLSTWGALVNVFLGAMLIGVLVTATATSEALLGPRSALGQRSLGALSWPGTVLRLLATGGLAAGALHLLGALVTALLGYSGPAETYLGYAPHAALALTLVAWPALEQGKGAYLDKLPPARRGLPEAAGS